MNIWFLLAFTVLMAYINLNIDKPFNQFVGYFNTFVCIYIAYVIYINGLF